MISHSSNRSRTSLYVVLLGIVVSILAGFAVAYVDVGSMGLSRILLLPLGALLLVPFFIAVSQERRINFLEPIFVVVFGYALFMFVRPLYILTFDYFDFMNFIGASKDAIPLALVCSIVGLTSLYLGYYSSVGPAVARRLPAGKRNVSPRRMRNLGFFVFLIGSLLYAAFLAGPAGGAKDSTDVTGSAYFYLGVNVAAVGILMLGYWTMLSPRWRRTLLVLALLAVFFVVSTYTGKRYHLLFLGMSLIASFYLLRGRPFSFRSLLVFLPSAFLYIAGVGFVRGGGTSVTVEEVATFNAAAAAQGFFASADLGSFDTFTRILTVVPESFPFVMPGRTFLYLFVAFVPRAIWPGKPLPTELVIMQGVVGDVGAVAGGSGYTYTLPGSLYIEGGVVMILIGMFVFGVFCRTIWSYYRLHGHLLSQAVLAISLPHLLLWQRGFNNNTIIWYLTFLVPIIFAFYYAAGMKGRKRKREEKHMAQPGEPPIDRGRLFRVEQCPICGLDESETAYPINKSYASSRSGINVSKVPLGVARCKECGHQFIQPVPQPEFLRAFYASYMSIAKNGFYRDRNREKIPSSFRQRYGRWLERIRVLGGGGSLLDVGSGLGTFLRLARERGFEVTGIEPNREAATMLRERYGIFVHNCMLEELNVADRYDVITMWDLLEHVPDPRLALGKSHELLGPRGLLVLETPARDSFIHWLAKGIYHASNGRIKKPLFRVYGVHHLQYFSERSLKGFLANCGFEVVEVHRDQTEVEALFQRPKGNGIVSRAKTVAFNTAIRGAFLLARLTGKQNKLIVFARKLGQSE